VTVTPASLQALEASTSKRGDTVDARIAKALEKMRRRGLDIKHQQRGPRSRGVSQRHPPPRRAA